MKFLRLLAAGALALVLFVAGPVLAQTTTAPPTPSPTTIDFAPLLNQVVWPLAGVVVTALAAWLSTKLAKLLNLSNADQVRGYLEPALQNALAFGQNKIGALPVTVDAKNAIVAQATNFAIQHVPDALKFFKIDEEGLKRILTARLEANVSAQVPEVTATTGAAAPAAAPAAPAT